jgi:hypothetical protein
MLPFLFPESANFGGKGSGQAVSTFPQSQNIVHFAIRHIYTMEKICPAMLHPRRTWLGAILWRSGFKSSGSCL